MPQYYEFVELGRKLVFSLVATFGSNIPTVTQIALSFFAVATVLCILLRTSPFVSDLYDVLSTYLTVVELVLLFLGVLVVFRDQVNGERPPDCEPTFPAHALGDTPPVPHVLSRMISTRSTLASARR